jgi:hypothetical protein
MGMYIHRAMYNPMVIHGISPYVPFLPNCITVEPTLMTRFNRLTHSPPLPKTHSHYPIIHIVNHQPKMTGLIRNLTLPPSHLCRINTTMSDQVRLSQ